MKSLLAFTLPLLFLFTAKVSAEDKCPISGKAVKDDIFLEVNGKKVHFCCDNCPKAFAEKNKFEAKDEGPKKCPISGKDAKDGEGTSLVVNGQKVYFCCSN